MNSPPKIQIIGDVIAHCRLLLEHAPDETADLEITVLDNADVNQQLHVVSPLKRSDLNERMLGAIDVRLLLSFPLIDSTLALAHHLSGSNRPTPPFLVSLAQLMPAELSFARSVFPFFENAAIEPQLMKLKRNIEMELWPLVIKSSTTRIFDDDRVVWPSSSPAKWWLYRAAKAVTYDSQDLALAMIKSAVAATNSRNISVRMPLSPEPSGVGAIAAKGDERTLKYVRDTLAVMPQLLSRPKEY